MPSNANAKKKKRAAKKKRQRERKKKNQKEENGNHCSNGSSEGDGDLNNTQVENNTENDVFGSNNAIHDGLLVEEGKKDCRIAIVEEGKSMEGSENDGQKEPAREASMVAVEVVQAVKDLESKLNRIVSSEFVGNGKGSSNGDESKKEIIQDCSVSQLESEDVKNDEIQVAKNLVEFKEIMLETSLSNQKGKKIDYGEVEQIGPAFEKMIEGEENRQVGKPEAIEGAKLPSKASYDMALTPSESPVIESYGAGDQSQESEIIETSQNQPSNALPTAQQSSWTCCCGLIEVMMSSKR